MSENAGTMNQLDPHGLGNYLSPAGVGSAIVAFFGVIPVFLGIVGGVFAITYYALSIYEMDTVQLWLKNRRADRLAREVALLETQQSAIVGRLKSLGVLVHADTTVSQPADGEPVKSTTKIETTTVQIKK